MDIPEILLKDLFFKTDLKSVLRGLNSLLGLNMSRSRLKTIRVFDKNVLNLIVSQIDLVKFILETDELEIPDSSKGIFYDEHSNEYKYIDILSGDPKESLFIFENNTSEAYVEELQKMNFVRSDKFHFYRDLLSAVLDASQLNNSVLFLFHDSSDSYIVNRALYPYPEEDNSFYYYSKIFKIQDNSLNEKTNFVIVNRHELTISSHDKVSDADLSQMVLPVIHLYAR